MDQANETDTAGTGRGFTTVDPARYLGRGSTKRIADELMGKVVLAAMKYQKRQTHDGATSRVLQEPIIIPPPGLVGWVVGTRQLPVGRVTGGYHREDPAEFTQEGAVQALLVTRWPNRRPIPVPMQCFVITTIQPSSGLSWADLRVPQRHRDEMREWAAKIQRDERGRWTA
jgi:hypothetical protein